MGRELRRVPPDWQHPRDDKGHLIPLMAGYSEHLAEWELGALRWAEGLQNDYRGGWEPIADKDQVAYPTWESWSGERPDPKDYMLPDADEGELTHCQAYEDTSNGTPLSPVFATPEECAQWCADNWVSAFGRESADYDWWIGVLRDGRFSGPVVTVPA